NPLVRFDGYFILSDILKLDNLSPRAFVFGKFLLHRLLTGVRISDPEIGSSKRLRFWLGVYFCAAIIYRLTLFVGICVAMLYFLPTVAAIPMCALVVGVFIAKPVAVEFSNISKLAWKNHSYLYLINMALLIGMILGVLFFPVRSTITGHAVVMPGESVQIFAVEPGRIMGFELKNGKRVEVGDTLFLIQSDELDAQISGTYARMNSLEKFVQRQVTDPKFRAAKTPYAEQLQQVQQLYQGLVTRKAAMTMKAPISGVLRDVEKSKRLGEWVNTWKPIARIVSDQGTEIIAYFDERNVSKMIAGTTATLVIDGLPEKAFPLTFVKVDPTAQATLLNPILASVHGGPIPVRLNRANQLIPETGIYRATFVPTDAKSISELPQRVLRGQVQVEGQATPLIIGFYRAIAGVILRETGVSLPAWWDS
ncbi:MAG: HlyD family efflux transporter periplasmic adaptor subunit, partial [Rhizobiales bacterium]|nr:HlyD family efflux transporter periplasmic adaptor subunit [Hyphomicrobiales bacterium]